MEEVIEEGLSKGVEMHVSGQFETASKLYESVIMLQPTNPAEKPSQQQNLANL